MFRQRSQVVKAGEHTGADAGRFVRGPGLRREVVIKNPTD